jgi:hypothetical protein
MSAGDSMATVLHIIDETTPPGILSQLSLLRRPGERVVCISPPPAGAGQCKVVRAPLGVAALASLALLEETKATGAEVLHAWSPQAAQAARCAAARCGSRVLLSLPGGCYSGLGSRQAVRVDDIHVSVPTEAERDIMLAGGAWIISLTQSSSTDVLRQSLDNSGTAMQGMPASRILSIAFSSTFKHATPTIAST